MLVVVTSMPLESPAASHRRCCHVDSFRVLNLPTEFACGSAFVYAVSFHWNTLLFSLLMRFLAKCAWCCLRSLMSSSVSAFAWRSSWAILSPSASVRTLVSALSKASFSSFGCVVAMFSFRLLPFLGIVILSFTMFSCAFLSIFILYFARVLYVLSYLLTVLSVLDSALLDVTVLGDTPGVFTLGRTFLRPCRLLPVFLSCWASSWGYGGLRPHAQSAARSATPR